MGSEKPCCPAAAARKVRKLSIGGTLIGIAELDTILEEVGRLAPASDAEARAELLAHARIFNYIPPQAEGGYAKALLEEYKRMRPSEGME